MSIYHGKDDLTVSIDAVIEFVETCKINNVDIELHAFDNCGHSFYLLKENQIENYYTVLGLSVKFLSEHNFIKI